MTASPLGEPLRQVRDHRPDERAEPFVSSGRVDVGATVRIVDPDSRVACAPGAVGEIWVQGGSVANGYWRRDAQTDEAFGARLASGEGPFLRTGDLGFLSADDLFITGRIKDLIIVAGRNLHPQDLEWSVEAAHPAVRQGGVAAFALDGGSTETVGVAAEVDARFARRIEVAGASNGEEVRALLDALRARVAEEHEVAIARSVLLSPGSLPKTSSGKIQRQECRRRLASGELATLADSQAGSQPAASPPLASDAERLDTGQRLRRAVAGILGVGLESVGMDQRLTALGVDSLRAMELSTWIEREFELPVELSELLGCSSLSAVGRFVDERRAAALATEEGSL